MTPKLIYPIEVGANPTANGGWEYFLLVARERAGQSCFRSEWVSPATVFPDLIRRMR